MMQKLWSLNWDEILPLTFQKQWEKLEVNIKMVEAIKIPRFIKTYDNSNIQIHGFCDASEKVYAAVVYVRVQTNTGVEVTMLGAKTRVTPLNKKITIPRLELCAALLLANYTNDIVESLKLPNSLQIYYWSDSKIALAWINGNPHRWKPFVEHRVT